MDYHSLPRKQLQALCKEQGIPANRTNVAMADALKSLNLFEDAAVKHPSIDKVALVDSVMNSPLPTSVCRGRSTLRMNTRTMTRTTNSRSRIEREEGEPTSLVGEVTDLLPEVNGLPELLKTPQTAVQSGRRITRSSARRQLQKTDVEGDDLPTRKLDLPSAALSEKEKDVTSPKASRRTMTKGNKDIKPEETKKEYRIPPQSSGYSTRRSARLRAVNPTSDRPSAKENLEKKLADEGDSEPLFEANKLSTVAGADEVLFATGDCGSTIGGFQEISIDQGIPSSALQFSRHKCKEEQLLCEPPGDSSEIYLQEKCIVGEGDGGKIEFDNGTDSLLCEAPGDSNEISVQEKCIVEEGDGGETEFDNGTFGLLSVDVSEENTSIHGDAGECLFHSESPQKNVLSNEILLGFPGEAPAEGNTLSVEANLDADESPRKNYVTNENPLEFPGESANGNTFSVEAISNQDDKSSSENDLTNEIWLEFPDESRALLNEDDESSSENDLTNEISLEISHESPAGNTLAVQAISNEAESPHRNDLTNEILLGSLYEVPAKNDFFSVEATSNESESPQKNELINEISFVSTGEEFSNDKTLSSEAISKEPYTTARSGERSQLPSPSEVCQPIVSVGANSDGEESCTAATVDEDGTFLSNIDSNEKVHKFHLLLPLEIIGKVDFSNDVILEPEIAVVGLFSPGTPNDIKAVVQPFQPVETFEYNDLPVELTGEVNASDDVILEPEIAVVTSGLSSPPSLRAWCANNNSAQKASPLADSSVSKNSRKTTGNASASRGGSLSARKKNVRMNSQAFIDKENANTNGTKAATFNGRKVRHMSFQMDKENNNASGTKLAASSGRKVCTGFEPLTDKESKNGSVINAAATLRAKKVLTDLLAESLSIDDASVTKLAAAALSGRKARMGMEPLMDKEWKNGSGVNVGATLSEKEVQTELLVGDMSTDDAKDNSVNQLMNLSLRKLKKMVKESEEMKNNNVQL